MKRSKNTHYYRGSDLGTAVNGPLVNQYLEETTMSRLTDSLKAIANNAVLQANATHGAITALNSQATQRGLEALAQDAVAEMRRTR